MELANRQPGVLRQFIVFHLPMLLYASLIVTLSSIPDMRTPVLTFKWGDKLAHLAEYGMFAFLAFRSFKVLAPGLHRTAALAMAMLFVGGFALVDEAYQSLVPGRYSDAYDLLYDLIGAACALGLSAWLGRRRKEG